MNRIVREHYPVSKLPEDLRESFGPDDEVRVTVDAAPTKSEAELNALPREARRVRRANFASIEEVNAYVRSLRD